MARDELMAKVVSAPGTMMKLVRHFGLGGVARLATSMGRTGGLADGATAYPALQNLLLAARALGLGAVLRTQHFFVPGEFEKVSRPAADGDARGDRPGRLADRKFGPVSRPAPESVVRWDRYDGGATTNAI